MQTKYVKLDDVIAILKANIQFNQQSKANLLSRGDNKSLSHLVDRMIADVSIKQSEALMNVFLDKLDIYDLNGEIVNEKSIEENN